MMDSLRKLELQLIIIWNRISFDYYAIHTNRNNLESNYYYAIHTNRNFNYSFSDYLIRLIH